MTRITQVRGLTAANRSGARRLSKSSRFAWPRRWRHWGGGRQRNSSAGGTQGEEGM
jgi:hypothetical protein